MAAPKGNEFWKARSTHGRNPKFDDPEKLLDACLEYFEWVEANPLKEEKIFQYQGEITRGDISKMRAMTISGLCIFLDICENTWASYRDRDDDYMRVTSKVESIIKAQKFSGAAADLLNANIIARDLGLKDESKRELDIPKGITVTLSKEDIDL